MVCNSETVGFLLRNKLWVGILVSGLQPIRWRTDPYSRLQMPEEKKSLVRSLVMGFSAEGSRQRQHRQHEHRDHVDEDNDDGDKSDPESDADFDDFIVGKGKGLIFLLHGEPGLGKTLTAESVAESTRKPLYQVSTGDLDIDVKGLEDQLVKVFRLGLRWGAVVLLDEADVFMARRSSAELQRNSIVAVFLRMIEYYEGMLFLTTNRVEDFDPAFYNRVHVTIQYQNLGPSERQNIWRQHLARACKLNRNRDLWNEDAYRLLGSIDTNGRDIRNATRTATGIARSTDADLDITHVVAVMRNNLSGTQDLAGTGADLGNLDQVLGELMQLHEKLKSAVDVRKGL
ncbi:P-loop containing nucleoside triphosphate hydrolase protein [Lasiosphaeria ovina]|uniref:P-loop containing nucleoside triphosphate hydrolase protein n=1 Tax=Lasiosphaeria ovina TaxID=92902 RepID=A0AAE0JT56_9PEZI|nr:P-loop containing nucleoside triphosphate hydrolase protein [Lasiosphaeria ovina]